MTFEEYSEQAVSTAIYPGQGEALGLIYCALKLNGEAGELAEHVGKAIRDDSFSEQKFEDWGGYIGEQGLTPERHQLIEKEVGDCLWYLAGLARELGTSLSAIADANIAKLAARKAAGTLGGSGDNR